MEIRTCKHEVLSLISSLFGGPRGTSAPHYICFQFKSRQGEGRGMVTGGSIPQGVLVPPGPWGAGVGWVERAMGRTGREEQDRAV